MTVQLAEENSETLFSSDGKISIVVIPSQQCYVVPLPNRQRFNSDSELTFELESHVLIDAECLAYSIQTQNGHSIAIVADGDSIVAGLAESTNSATIAICPKALLTIDGFFCEPAHIGTQKSGCFVIQSDRHADIVLVDQGKVAQWRYSETRNMIEVANEVIRSHKSMAISKIVVLSTRTNDDSDESDFRQTNALNGTVQPIVPVEFCDRSASDLLRDAALAVLDGRMLPMVCLRSERLKAVDPNRPAYRHALCFIASICLLGACLIGGFYLRASRYRSETEALLARQEAVFKRVFPKQKIPVGMLSRFQSEQRRLSLTKGTQSRPMVPNALEVLHAFLAALPEPSKHYRYQIQSLRIEQSSFSSLVGRVESPEALDQLRRSLTVAGFSLPPVSIRPDTQGVPIQWTGVSWSKPKPNADQPLPNDLSSESHSL